MATPPKNCEKWDEGVYRRCFEDLRTPDYLKQWSALAALKELQPPPDVPLIQRELEQEWHIHEDEEISMLAEFSLAEQESYRKTVARNCLFGVAVFFRERADGHIFMDPMPGPHYFHAYYDSSYGTANLKKCNNPGYIDRKRESAKKLAAFVEQSLTAAGQGSSRNFIVLEVGAGLGCLIGAGRDLYEWQPEAVEMVPEYVKYLRTMGVTVHDGDFVSLASSFRKKYSLVLMNDVLEHLPDPARAMRTANAVLRVGGALFIETPQLIRGAVFSPSQHVNNFSVRSLIELVEQNGFVTVSFQRSEEKYWREYYSSGRYSEPPRIHEYYEMQVVAVKSREM